MDRRSFLQSGSLAAAAGAAIANAVVPAAAAADDAAAHSRDWSNRNPKGEPVVKRFDEQRWLLDNVIQANGIDWDQSHTGAAIAPAGPAVVPDMAELRQQVKRLVDIGPAFEALAKKREDKAQDAEQAGNKTAARDNYFFAANYWASAMWTIDEVNAKLKNAERQEARELQQIHGARRPPYRMGRAAISRQDRCRRSFICRRIIKAAPKCR